MAMKNIAAALGDLEREKKSKNKNTKTSSNKNTKKKTIKTSSSKHINTKNIKTEYQSVKLVAGVKKKLWINRINTGETITAAINRIVDTHLK